MEFAAYPTTVPTGRKDVRALLKIQNVLHSTDSILLPATMLLTGVALVAYEHFTNPYQRSRSSVRTFLIKIVISMIPLGILELKVPKCADPVGLFAKFSTKVMLMHVAFLTLRWTAVWWDVQMEYHYFNTFMLLAALVLLPTVFGFRPTPRGLWEQRDVFALVLSCLVMAVWEVETYSWLSYKNQWFFHRYMEDIISTSSDYIEIVAFVPAVWMAFRKGSEIADDDIQKVSVSQKRALGLFAFMVAFYSSEDIRNAASVWGYHRMAAVGHMIHYLILLDFAGFLLAHLCDPEKLQAMKGTFMTWVADCCAV